MTRIQLRLYVDPGAADVFVRLKRTDGNYVIAAPVIDTGAEVSLFPAAYLPGLAARVIGTVEIEQAGIAHHRFSATEAMVTLYLEDLTGARTEEFEAPIWFADTSRVIIGFKGVLDRAVLHLDMPARGGWLELDA